MQQGDQAWLDLRDQHAVTWSQAGNAIGVGYDSRRRYMKRKLGMIPKTEANWRMTEGNRREPWGAELYHRIMGWCGVDVELEVHCFASDPSDRRIGGSPDRIVRDKLTGERWLLEIKTCPGGDMRTEIPITHLVQMLGLCHTYGLHKAHYICWSQHQGILISEVYFHPQLVQQVFRWLTEFADLWSVRALPGRMEKGEREKREFIIRQGCFISEINCVATKRLLRERQLREQSSCAPAPDGTEGESDPFWARDRFLGASPFEAADQ